MNQLDDVNAITSVEKEAQSALYGTYGILNGNTLAFNYYMPAAASLMGLTMDPAQDGFDFRDNNPATDNYWLENMYSGGYKMINMSNHIISKTAWQCRAPIPAKTEDHWRSKVSPGSELFLPVAFIRRVL